MQLSGRATPIVLGIMLATGITLTLPYLASAATHSAGGSGRFGAPRMRPERSLSRPFRGPGFLGVGGFGGQQVIIIQQFQFPATSEPREFIDNKIYIPPRWVDGGHGVQVLKPGYWTDPKQEAVR
ncbi:MAG: hypothetical protein ACM3TN_03445 [Alphaproteobacteria bacterium]